MSAPISPEVAAHELTVQVIETGTRALRVGGEYIDRERTAPRWNVLERWARRRECAAVLRAIALILGADRLPDTDPREELDAANTLMAELAMCLELVTSNPHRSHPGRPAVTYHHRSLEVHERAMDVLARARDHIRSAT